MASNLVNKTRTASEPKENPRYFYLKYKFVQHFKVGRLRRHCETSRLETFGNSPMEDLCNCRYNVCSFPTKCMLPIPSTYLDYCTSFQTARNRLKYKIRPQS